MAISEPVSGGARWSVTHFEDETGRYSYGEWQDLRGNPILDSAEIARLDATVPKSGAFAPFEAVEVLANDDETWERGIVRRDMGSGTYLVAFPGDRTLGVSHDRMRAAP